MRIAAYISKFTTCLLIVLPILLVAAPAIQAGAVRTVENGGLDSISSTFTSMEYPNLNVDDGSVLMPLPFEINFFTENLNDLNINVNGTLGSMENYTTYSPQDHTQIDHGSILSLFQVDHNTNNGGSVTVYYAKVNGNDAFVVNWNAVAPYDLFADDQTSGETNTYQIVIIDIDGGDGKDFDVEFNYDNVEWDTYGPFVGFSGLSNTNTWALANSLTDNSFKNTDSYPLIYTRSEDSDVLGRIKMQSRSGVMSEPSIVIGDVTSELEITISEGPTYNSLVTIGEYTATGSLTVTLNGYTPVNGDIYNIISAESITGNFTSYSLPELSGGPFWTTANLFTSGNIGVVAIFSGELNVTINSGSNAVGPILGLGYDIVQPSTLNVTFNGYTPVGGDTIKIITANSIAYFSDVTVPSLNNGLLWDFSRLYSDGELSIRPASFNITGAIAWYDVSDLGSLGLENDAASFWLDKVGNTNLYQSIDIARPNIVASRINGRPILEFDGVEQYFISQTNPLSGTTSRTVICVMQGVEGPIYSFAAESSSEGARFGLVADSLLDAGGMAIMLYNQGANNERFNILSLTAAQDATVSDAQLYMNGSRLAVTNVLFPDKVLNTLDTTFRVGSDTNALFMGEIAELILFDRQLSKAELDSVHRYLRKKYGIYTSSQSLDLNLW